VDFYEPARSTKTSLDWHNLIDVSRFSVNDPRPLQEVVDESSNTLLGVS